MAKDSQRFGIEPRNDLDASSVQFLAQHFPEDIFNVSMRYSLPQHPDIRLPVEQYPDSTSHLPRAFIVHEGMCAEVDEHRWAQVQPRCEVGVAFLHGRSREDDGAALGDVVGDDGKGEL